MDVKSEYDMWVIDFRFKLQVRHGIPKRTQQEFGFALVRYTTGFKNSHPYFTRSEPVKQNQSRKRFPCFASATCIYFEFNPLHVICQSDHFGFDNFSDFKTLNKLA